MEVILPKFCSGSVEKLRLVLWYRYLVAVSTLGLKYEDDNEEDSDVGFLSTALEK